METSTTDAPRLRDGAVWLQLAEVVRTLRVETLRWGSGLYFLVLGLSFLLLPQGPVGQWLNPSWVPGGMLVLAGLATLWLMVLPLPRHIAVPITLICVLPPLGITAVYFWLGVVPAATTLGLFTLGAALAPLARPPADATRFRPDALGLVLGLIVVVQGMDFLSSHPAAAASTAASFGLPATSIGTGLVVGGVAVVGSQLITATPPVLRWLAHVACGSVVLWLQAGIAILIDPLYWVLGMAGTLRGIALLILPWWSERAEAFDQVAFRPRLALALVTAALLPVAIALPVVLTALPEGSAALTYARQVAFGSSLLVILLAGVGGWWLAGSLAAPLQRLMHGVQAIAKQQATALPPQQVTELVALSEAVEQMAQTLAARAEERAQLYESEQEARMQAQAAVQMRDAFLSVAAHELRSPLTALLGNAQLLQRRLKPGATVAEREQRQAGVVVDQAARLDRLIGELLDVSRLEMGQLQLNRTPLELTSLVQRLIEETRPLLNEHQLVYEGPGQPIVVSGDELRLTQVMQNLLGNAVKYSPAGGAVTVRVCPESNHVVIAFCDVGIGIPAEALPNLFQRFYRASNAERQGIGGMGVGLYVVHEIVSLHGGTLDVASVEGQGSTFTVRLPLPGVEEGR
ncbi:MAG: HAMP domain-containing histidine kinase [Chloroflexaceae bacterium]|jgi:signal transduction histidine kinase|nr:HAMP domain-containing histidine kinase [Chloroflexaceae bacterium]